MMIKVYGFALNFVEIDKDFKSKPATLNATLGIAYLKPTPNGLVAVFDEVRFDIYAVTKYYKNTKDLKAILFALAENKKDELNLEASGSYTSKKFEKQILILEKEIQKGIYQ